jgi:hypothetical protein
MEVCEAWPLSDGPIMVRRLSHTFAGTQATEKCRWETLENEWTRRELRKMQSHVFMDGTQRGLLGVSRVPRGRMWGRGREGRESDEDGVGVMDKSEIEVQGFQETPNRDDGLLVDDGQA